MNVRWTWSWAVYTNLNEIQQVHVYFPQTATERWGHHIDFYIQEKTTEKIGHIIIVTELILFGEWIKGESF